MTSWVLVSWTVPYVTIWTCFVSVSVISVFCVVSQSWKCLLYVQLFWLASFGIWICFDFNHITMEILCTCMYCDFQPRPLESTDVVSKKVSQCVGSGMHVHVCRTTNVVSKLNFVKRLFVAVSHWFGMNDFCWGITKSNVSLYFSLTYSAEVLQNTCVFREKLDC